MTADDTRAKIERLRADLPLYAANFLKIKTKEGPIAPLKMNSAQKRVQNALEKQLKERGFVRAIIVKGRQQGISTLVAARFFHKTAMNPGKRAFVLTHLSSATNTLFDIVKHYYSGLPQALQPHLGKSNYNELGFDKLRSGFKVSTAGSGDVGRGDTVQLLHGSEVALWSNQDQIVTGLLQAVPLAPGTEIILESTSQGATGFFYEQAMRALRGEGDYQLIFCPWFLQAEYSRPAPADFVLTDDEKTYQTTYELSREQMFWRRQKIWELGSVSKFRREYPGTAMEAFMADVDGALWKRDDVKTIAKEAVPELKRVVLGLDPATTAKASSDETGIIVAGLGVDDKVYILRDLSGRHKVEDWAALAIAAYHEFNVDKIVAETNQGGDMVLHAMRAIDPMANVIGKHVSVSKVARHEPVSALYRRGLVHHAGDFSTLVDQMCSWNPILQPKESPDRVDALTLAVAELGLSLLKTPFVFVS